MERVFASVVSPANVPLIAAICVVSLMLLAKGLKRVLPRAKQAMLPPHSRKRKAGPVC